MSRPFASRVGARQIEKLAKTSQKARENLGARAGYSCHEPPAPTNCDGQRDLPHFNHVADLRPRSEDVVEHKTTDPLDEILSIPEAAQQLDLPERDVRAFLADGSLRGAKIGGRWVTSMDAVAELADGRGCARRTPPRRRTASGPSRRGGPPSIRRLPGRLRTASASATSIDWLAASSLKDSSGSRSS
jgi:hypothetical protein